MVTFSCCPNVFNELNEGEDDRILSMVNELEELLDIIEAHLLLDVGF